MRFELLALTGLLSTALAHSLPLYLPAKPNPFTLPASTHATLSSLHAHHSSPVSSLNTFLFHNLTADSYLLDVHCPTDVFQPLRIDVKDDGTIEAWETYRGNEWDNKGEKREVKAGSAGTGVELKALGGKMYFAERPSFSVMTILKNPMILMGLVSMVMFVGMPKLMENMDPEMKAELEQQQRNGPLAAMQGGGQPNPLGNFDMAAYLSGANKKKDEGVKR